MSRAEEIEWTKKITGFDEPYPTSDDIRDWIINDGGVLEQDSLKIRRNKNPDQLGEILNNIHIINSVKKIDLTSCIFPDNWSTENIGKMRHLTELTIYNPAGGDPQPPADRLAGVRDAGVKTLILARCTFTKECWPAISTMDTLETLTLDRTITTEKFDDNDRQVATNSICSLIRLGNLRTLRAYPVNADTHYI
jgi:hypothetical protein